MSSLFGSIYVFKKNYVNGNILQCITRYNYRFMKLTWLKPSPVGLMDQKKLIDILNSVMFPQPGSVSVFNSFHSLVFFSIYSSGSL